MATFWPATVSEPVRALDAGFAATEKVTVPLPFPEAPDRIVTKPELLAAVQAQPGAAVTLTVPVPPPPGNEAGTAPEIDAHAHRLITIR